MLLVALPPRQAVVGGGRDEQRRGRSRAEEREEVHVLLEVGRLGEALRKGDAEQEREEHLHARQGHAQLVQELDQLPVQALLLASPRPRAYVKSFPAAIR